MPQAARIKSGEPRTSTPFAISCALHGGLLVWLMFASALTPREKPKSIYDQEIRPYENKIVWYNLREKLPDIKPASSPASIPKPPRAQRQFKQTLVAGKKDDPRAPQMIVTESPEVELPQPLPLPNVVAEAAPVPKPPKLFQPPQERKSTQDAPALPESPNAELKPLSATAVEKADPRPKPKDFQTPAEKKAEPAASPAIPDPPRVAAAQPAPAGSPLGAAGARPQPLPFQPPPERRTQTQARLTLPESPGAKTAPSGPAASPLGVADPKPPPKAFQGPPPLRATQGGNTLTLPESPKAAEASQPAPAAPRIPRNFTPPPAKSAAGQSAQAPMLDRPPPALTNPQAIGTQSLAIASLDPTTFTGIPAPPPSHDAGFSGAPAPKAGEGEASASEKASLVVPKLTAAGGSHDAMPTLSPGPDPNIRSRLMAAVRDPLAPAPVSAPRQSLGSRALRVSSSPDPRMAGRVVYTMAIQMPNVTSYSGSWMVWYAERVPEPGAEQAEIRPPLPRQKVDPAYIRSAVDDGVQGMVRLAAVITREGTLEQIQLLRGVDTRLDQSAKEALSKWLFEPAMRDGTPIEVDAVFEVPFRLAPKTIR